MRTVTHQLTRATVAFATLVLTTSLAATPVCLPHRVVAERLLAEEVATRNQLSGLVVTNIDFAGETLDQSIAQ